MPAISVLLLCMHTSTPLRAGRSISPLLQHGLRSCRRRLPTRAVGGSSAAEGLAAVLLAKRWTMGKTAEAAVGQEAAALLARPLRSLSLDEAITVGLAFVKHAASDKGSKEEL